MDTKTFTDHLSESLAGRARAARDLPARLAEAVTAARAAWPELSVTDDAFLQFVAVRLPEQADVADALASVHTDALYLTCACAAGDEPAIELFEARFAKEIEIALASMALDGPTKSEVRQQIRTKLFVGGPETPGKIASYTGRGDLRSWVRAVAVRTAISLLRKRKRVIPVPDPVLGAIADPADNPELAHLKDVYRSEFRAAFKDAFAELAARDRTILRYKFADGLTIDDIADIYNVHRATAARWLAKIRDDLFKATRRHLQGSLQVGSSEFDSIVRLISSRLDVTLSGMWAAESATPEESE